MSAEAATVPDNGANRQWFVVHTYSGFENKVAEAIQSRAKIFGMGEKITRVLVPTEKVVEVRNKQKRETEQKFFPGYVLVEMVMPGDNVTMAIELIMPIAMEKELRFAIREGGRTVGAGVVTEITE